MNWPDVLRGQALSCNEIAVRLGKSRPTTLKIVQEAVQSNDLEAREKDSIIFYSIRSKTKN